MGDVDRVHGTPRAGPASRPGSLPASRPPSRAAAIAVGAAGGTASGLLGVGGGVVLVPLLVRFLGLGQHRAHGTSLAIVVCTVIAAAIAYRAAAPLDLGLAAWLAGGAVLGAPLGARATAFVTSAGLRRAFGAFLVLVGARLFLVQLPDGDWLALPGAAGAVAAALVGLGIGLLSGFLGIGGGVILVPILVLFFGLPQLEAQGVSLFMMIPTALVGAWTHSRMGNVEGSVVGPAAAASVVAAVGAALVAGAMPGLALRFLFAALLVGTGLRLLVARGSASAGKSAMSGGTTNSD